MRRTALRTALFTALAVAPSGVFAQLAPPTPDQLAAGDRVATAEFSVDELVVERESTVGIEVRLLDAEGAPVEEAVALLVARAPLSPAVTALVPGAPVQFTARQPGSGALGVIVLRGEPSDQVRIGPDNSTMVGTIPVRVLDWPAGSIEIEEPEYQAYVGTSMRLVGTVLTDRSTEHGTAEITWSSSDPARALLTGAGVLTGVAPGRVEAVARTENDVVARLELDVLENPVTALRMEPAAAQARTGDVIEFEIVPTDGEGRPVDDVAVDLSVSGLDRVGGFVFRDGTFVAEEAGAYRVLATVGGVSTAALVEVEAREVGGNVEFVSQGVRSEVATSDLWVFEGVDGRDYAYTGTHAQGGGQRMFVWDVTDPAEVVLTDSVVVDARVVNDVKVNAEATWAIITREGASTRRNGIVVLDLDDPAHPTILSELTEDMTGGIHNVWIMGDVVYAVNNGTNAMHIIDLSDPANPAQVGRWELRPGDPGKTLHDVWAEDGYAYLSYWDDGLVILDVGAGTHGGTPTEPEFVSRISYPEGNTHVAWRDRDYVFVGDEIGTADGMRGFVHVIDVSDIEQPREVAKYELPEAGAHNLWVENDVLYIAYYQGGLRMVDISGTLRGDLYRQGREIAFFRTRAREGEGLAANRPDAWGPQVHKGHLFVSDMNSGLWVLRHDLPRPAVF